MIATTSPPMPSPRIELLPSSRAGRTIWCLLPPTLLALLPKCLLCVLAYAGLGTVLGLGGPEICGASGSSVSWTSWLALAGTGFGTFRFVVGRRRHRRSPRVSARVD